MDETLTTDPKNGHTHGHKLELCYIVHDDAERCPTCIDIKANGGFGPPHKASDRCESGKYAHCSCDTCF